MQKSTPEALEVVTVPQVGGVEYFISGQAVQAGGEAELIAAAARSVQAHHAQVITCRVSLTVSVRPHIEALLNKAFGDAAFPVVWLRQYKDDPAGFSLQIHAAQGLAVRSMYDGTRLCGCVFADAQAEYSMLYVLPEDITAPPMEQARQVFEGMGRLLAAEGMDFSQTVRTWLYADDILTWYWDLNKVRDAFFDKHGIFQKLVPASTGIGLANGDGAALSAELLAVRPRQDAVRVEAVASPLQCSAMQYRASFSRAVSVAVPGQERLYISGTASIDGQGKTVYVGDAAEQVAQTMRVVEAILKSRQMGWPQVTRAMAYYKHSRDRGLLEAYCQAHGIVFPCVQFVADVCRDELLFELELDAIKSGCQQ